ncbi:hypothetical protein SAY87_028030 [Trapa incisa]|uniref:Uncharacterized protein n=1 Tax=Trapa incisa TaxID=236973 RepID=A0AAN7QPA9_9MYRT|nr:hypothetical protein SAY87_028030 [Trapa incisa]
MAWSDVSCEPSLLICRLPQATVNACEVSLEKGSIEEASTCYDKDVSSDGNGGHLSKLGSFARAGAWPEEHEFHPKGNAKYVVLMMGILPEQLFQFVTVKALTLVLLPHHRAAQS